MAQIENQVAQIETSQANALRISQYTAQNLDIPDRLKRVIDWQKKIATKLYQDNDEINNLNKKIATLEQEKKSSMTKNDDDSNLEKDYRAIFQTSLPRSIFGAIKYEKALTNCLLKIKDLNLKESSTINFLKLDISNHTKDISVVGETLQKWTASLLEQKWNTTYRLE